MRAIGLFTTVSAAGGAIGLVAGGFLTQLVSWRWVMFVNVPIGIAVFVVGRMVLGRDRAPPRALRRLRRDELHVGYRRHRLRPRRGGAGVGRAR